MPKKNILSLEDLYNYFAASKRSRRFSSADDNKNIVVQVPGNISFGKSDDSTEGLTPVILQSCHIDTNLNGSKIDKKVMEKALPSFSNRPILGYIHEVDGEWQFYDHRMHVEDDEIVYDEVPIGIIPESCDAHLEYDEEQDLTYTVVSGYLFDEYSRAVEILQRDKECSVSVELAIRELSYNAKEKVLNIEDFYFCGVTALGKTPDGDDVKPGMRGSNMKLADFTRKSDFAQDDVIGMLNEINDKLTQLSIKNIEGKEENQMEFEENVEVTETPTDNAEVEQTMAAEEDVEEATTEESNEGETNVAEVMSDETDDVAPSEETDEKYEVNYSVVYGDKKQDFSVSLQDKISALYALVNDLYSEQDGCWYDVEVFEDPKYVIMSDWWSGKGYKQSYKVKNGTDYQMVGDRTPVKQIWVTEDEEKQLDQMKSNYAEISDKLAKYEAEPEKLEILNSADYSSIAESEEFVAFKMQDAHFDLSVDEVRAKADAMLLNAVKQGKVEFASNAEEPKKEIGMKKLPITKKSGKTGRYGGIFVKN